MYIYNRYLYIYTYYMIGAWLNMAILARIYGKTRILPWILLSGPFRTMAVWPSDTVGIFFVFFSLPVGIKSWNGRTNAKQLNFTIWKDPESKIQSDLIAQNKCLIGKQTTNLPGFAVNEPFIPSLVHIKDFTTGDISMEFTSTSPTWHHGSWDYKVIWP